MDLNADLSKELAIVKALLGGRDSSTVTRQEMEAAEKGREAAPSAVLVVGDTVKVLRASRLPVEDVIGVGVVERVTDDSERLYWVRGFLCARTARELRRV